MKVWLDAGKGNLVRSGHPWIYRNEIGRMEGDPVPGETVEVFTANNIYIGTGYINLRSMIAIRLLSRVQGEIVDREFFKRRLLACRAYRKKLGFTQNYRLVFGEGDFLPALVIDIFKDIAVMQTLSAGMDVRKHMMAEVLTQDMGFAGVYERNDVPVRALEGLEETRGLLAGSVPEHIEIEESGLHFLMDTGGGQKTGFFLDQRDNRLALDPLVRGANMLDCFTYTGSFALFAAHFGAASVLAADSSESAIAQAEKNAARNHCSAVTFRCMNVFDMLPEFVQANMQFDVVLLDPPAFTKNRKGVVSALRGYKEINLRAMKLLPPGGFLISFSCSHFIGTETFAGMLAEAAHDAMRTLREVRYLTQSADHPVVWGIDETQYLKGFILQVL